MTAIAADRKQLILEDAKARILQGDTLKQIADTHGITKQTLNTWLMSLGDEYTELRQAWIDNMLSEVQRDLDGADEQFALAHARERWKAVTWLAERRDRLRYGQQVANINIINGVTLSEALVGEAGELLEHISDTD